jgi:flagellar biosynthesis/type III secretory pathway M-ring protein FliF/YscJ
MWWPVGLWAANTLASGLLGGLVKWFLDRRIIRGLKADRAAAQKYRESAHRSRQKALKERQAAIEDLAIREAELRRKNEELERIQQKVAAYPRRNRLPMMSWLPRTPLDCWRRG